MEKLVRQIIGNFSLIRRPKNWVLKLLSFFFALFLWYFVVGEDKVDMNVTIPVEIVNLPRNLVISNQFKKQLEVTVSGQRSLIRGMTEQHISRSIDLSRATPGTVLIQNQPDSISLPRGLNILRVQPPTITLLLDRLIQKELPIKPVLVGKVHNDFRLDSVTTEPQTLEISGPQTILSEEEVLTTSPVDINGISQSSVRQVPLALRPEIADLIGEPVVAVRINIADLQKEIEIADLPVDIDVTEGKPAEIIYLLKPSAISLTAELPQRMLRESEEVKNLFHAKITPTAFKAGRYKLNVIIEGPPPAKILSVSPDTVTLEVIETEKLKITK
jgi:YbbR domain-containing protein